MFSIGEIIQTILALIAGWYFIVRYSMPMLEEWLEGLSMDDTTEGSDDHDAG